MTSIVLNYSTYTKQFSSTTNAICTYPILLHLRRVSKNVASLIFYTNRYLIVLASKRMHYSPSPLTLTSHCNLSRCKWHFVTRRCYVNRPYFIFVNVPLKGYNAQKSFEENF